MTITVIQKLAASFTDTTLPKLYRDPVMNAGSLFLFDFLNSYSNPNADGALVAGTTFKNLVDGGADGVLVAGVGSGNFAVTSLAGKAGLNSGGAINVSACPTLTLGGIEDTLDKPFVSMAWVKQSGAPASSALNQPILGDTNETDSGGPYRSWMLYTGGTTGTEAYALQRSGSTVLQTSGRTAGADIGHVTLYGVGWNAGTLSFYVNGALFAAATGLASPIRATGLAPYLNFGMPGTFYRTYMERTDLSGRTALAAIQDEYARNSSRFT